MKMLAQCWTPLEPAECFTDADTNTLNEAEPGRCAVGKPVQGNSVVSMIAALMVVIIWGLCLLYYPQEHDKN